MLFALFTGSAGAQNQMILFFKAGESNLSAFHSRQLDSLAEVLKRKEHRVSLTGHADTVGSEQRNELISNLRVRSVYAWLVSKGVDRAKIVSSHVGEKQPLFPAWPAELNSRNRCVVIRFEESIEQREKPAPEVNTAKKFENDTVIRAPGGALIEIPADAFFPRKISEVRFDVKEVYTVCDMVSNQVLTRATTGECLTSAGMLFIRPTIDGVEVQPNKGSLVTIRIPTGGGVPDKEMKLYGGVRTAGGNMIWKNIDPEVTYAEQGTQYYVFRVDSLTSFNLDKPLGIICRKDGHRMKVPRFKDVIITQTYPDENYLSVAEKNSTRKYTLDKVNKDNNPVITIIAFDRRDNPYMARGPLYDLTYRRGRDLFVVRKHFFSRILRDRTRKMTPADYLCSFSGYLGMR
jgi:hypothetical protein